MIFFQGNENIKNTFEFLKKWKKPLEIKLIL